MIRKIFLAVLIATSAMAMAQDQLRVSVHTLSNGMTVWLNEDHSTPKVYGAVVVHAGSNDCPNTGIAHYFEHILFKGTQHIGTTNYQQEKTWLDSIAAQYDILSQTKDGSQRASIQKKINELSIKAADYAIPNEFNNLLSAYGGTEINAYTSFDETVYHNSFSPQYINQWCELNSERLIDPVYRLFQGELETVYEEKNMYADNILANARDHVQGQVFYGTPYQFPIIGSTENLKNPSQTQMQAFYDKYYVARNMTLLLAGDIQADSIMPLLEKTFGRIRAGEVPQREVFDAPQFDGTQTIPVKIRIPLVKAAGYVYSVPNERDRDFIPLRVAMKLLSNGNQTGLLDSLCNENRLMMAMGDVFSFKNMGLAAFGFIPKIPFGSLKKADAMALKQIEKLRNGGFSDASLEAVKTAMKRDAEQDLENIDTRKYLMQTAIANGRSWEDVLHDTEAIDQVTREDIMRVTNKYLANNYMRLEKKFGSYPKDKLQQPGYQPVHPKSNGQKSEYAKKLANMPYQKAEPKFINFSNDATIDTLAPLIKLYTVKNTTNDIFRLNLIYRKGTLENPLLNAAAEYMGLVGTDSLNKTQLEKTLQQLGTTIGFDAGKNHFTITLSGFDRNLLPSLHLLRTLMDNPQVDHGKKNDISQSLAMEEKTLFQDNASIAEAVMEKVEYGNLSTFLTHFSGKEAKKASTTDLIGAFKNVLKSQLDITYSGTLNSNTVAEYIRETMPIELVNEPYKHAFRPLQTYSEPQVIIFDNPKARQNIIGTYISLPKADNTDARARQILWANYFGGGMSSLMFQEIREFRSYAYYAYGNTLLPSLSQHPDSPTAFIAQLGTQADKSMLAINVMDSLLNDMPLIKNNIDAAKQSMINNINNNYPDFRNMANEIAYNHILGYQEDPNRQLYYATAPLGINDVRSFYDSYIHNTPRILIIVGNKKSLDIPALSKLGKVTFWTKKDIYKE